MKYFVTAALVLAACSKPVDLKQEEAKYDAYIAGLPELKEVPRSGKVVLKVHYVERPQLPALDTSQREDLYRLTEDLVIKTLGYDLKIEETIVYRAKDFLKAVAPRFKASPQRYPALAYQISFFAADRDARVLDAIKPALAKHPAERIAKYLGEHKTPEAATRFFIERLGAIYGETDYSGKAILGPANADEEVLFSYGHWSSILQGEREADFILTNTGIIGADTGMPLYVIARGGVTSAFVENNAYRPFQGVGVIGLYPFLSDGAVFRAQRGDLTIEQKIETIAWIWVHELGHLLLKKDENYAFEDSIHRAAPDLHYYDWVRRVKASRNHRSDQVPMMKKF
ncbi:MAG TPA: hypothetical protein PKM44_15575 [Turneriella sp.]|nr:hypothetical protein [Turneriella sp.]HNE18826.1 hypothetical protein [Turneriella sp.]HNJ65339.1 hypothetical protein [Turneriella sp.]HNL11930.1 hypothetical protein [Turneriella sp.]HNL54325.1 hypothetical protein [Turneriella sp.]